MWGAGKWAGGTVHLAGGYGVPAGAADSGAWSEDPAGAVRRPAGV